MKQTDPARIKTSQKRWQPQQWWQASDGDRDEEGDGDSDKGG